MTTNNISSTRNVSFIVEPNEIFKSVNESVKWIRGHFPLECNCENLRFQSIGVDHQVHISFSSDKSDKDIELDIMYLVEKINEYGKTYPVRGKPVNLTLVNLFIPIKGAKKQLAKKM